jgi:hypothetical protein
MTAYNITDPTTGRLIAVHHRIVVSSDGRKKRMWWTAPDGSTGLPAGVHVRDLPLYRTRLGAGNPVLIVEGEKSAEALAEIGIPALATVTGAASCPSPEALRPDVRGRNVYFWADHDEAGRLHAEAVLTACADAGAIGLGIVAYRPSNPAYDWPKGYDAADVVHDMPRQVAVELVTWIVTELLEPFAPKPSAHKASAHNPVGASTSHGSASGALMEVYGIEASPGRSVVCPKHDDRSASLWIAPDDDRAICMTPSCEWSSPGADAFVIKSVEINL